MKMELFMDKIVKGFKHEGMGRSRSDCGVRIVDVCPDR